MNARSLWIIPLTMFLFTSVQAQDVGQPAVERVQPQLEDHDIATFMTRDTVIVTRLDLDRIDLQRTEQWARGLIEDLEIEEPEHRQALAHAARQFGQSETWVGNMKQAGAERVYFMLNIREQRAMPVVVAPNIPEDQVQTVKVLLTPLPHQEDPREGLQTTEIRGAVVLAHRAILDELKQPVERTEEVEQLTAALREIEGASIKFVLRPTEQGRRTAAMMGARFEDEQVRDVQWVAIGLGYAREEERAFRMVLKAPDAERAEQIAQRWNEFLEESEGELEARPAAARLAEHRDALEPKVENDRVIVTLTDEQANEVLREALLPMVKVQQEEIEREEKRREN